MTKEEAKLKLERVEEIIQRYKNDMEGWIDESKRLQEIIYKKDDCDSPQCEKCGGRAALIAGTFYYDPDAEPYKNGVEEDSNVESGDCWAGGFKCDDCGNIQGLWNE